MDFRPLPGGALRRARLTAWLLTGLLALPAAGQPREQTPVPPPASPAPADALRDSLTDEGLRELVDEVLARSPEIARARQRAAAAAARAPQVKALPDPEATLTVFVQPPETRVGPQRLQAAVAQRFPWFGKLALRERAALYAAAESRAQVEAVRLRLLTAARRLAYELAFLTERAAIVAEEREHLLRHEEVARARYSAGMGLQQEVLKIQADVTRSETRQVEIEARRRSVLASLNALRDRPAELEVPAVGLPRPRPDVPPIDDLRRQALRRRPELAAIRAEIGRREVLVDLAGKELYPDLRVGLGYTVVGRREDAPGRLNPPPDDGDDVLALTVGANLPVWKRRIEAGLEEALKEQSAAEEGLRQTLAEIEGRIGDAAARAPLLFQQWRLFETVLLAQAEEALRSSEAAYTTGKLNALDLLDAEHVLFEVRTAAARTRADHAVATAELEGATGGGLSEDRTTPATEGMGQEGPFAGSAKEVSRNE